MKNLLLNPSTLGFIVVTRALLAAGAGLMLASRLNPVRRRKVGTALIAVGAATTLPALFALRNAARRGADVPSSVGFSRALKGAARFPRKGDAASEDDLILRDERAYRFYDRENR